MKDKSASTRKETERKLKKLKSTRRGYNTEVGKHRDLTPKKKSGYGWLKETRKVTDTSNLRSRGNSKLNKRKELKERQDIERAMSHMCFSQKKDLGRANRLLKRIFSPDYCGPLPEEPFTKGIFETTNQCTKFASEGYLNYVLQTGTFLGPEETRTIGMICQVIALINLPTVSDNTIQRLEHLIPEMNARKEIEFPLFMNTMMFHLLHHIPAQMKEHGPLIAHSMYGGERMIGNLTKRMTSTRFPEKSSLSSVKMQSLCTLLGYAGVLTTHSESSPDTLKNESRNISRTEEKVVKMWLSNKGLSQTIKRFETAIWRHRIFKKQYTYRALTNESNFENSTVAVTKGQVFHVGKTLGFFQFDIHGQDMRLAYIRWHGSCTYDADRFWWPVHKIDRLDSLENMSTLSRPLVYSYDNSGTMVILNLIEHFL